jgi:general nucleoside transport system ATP-binding protein
VAGFVGVLFWFSLQTMKIQLESIRKRFGRVQANDSLSLSIAEGTIHGLLGENGAGKTTLMKILSGYQSADSGRILLDGQAASFASPAEAIARGIGMLHQDPLDVPPFSVLDNFVLGRPNSFVQHHRAAEQELLALSRRFGFDLDPHALVASLTMGERQQLEIVRLLALGVRVIILDEPTTGISAPQKALLFATLHRLASEGLTVIFVSHKLDEVEALCSTTTVLRRGQVAGEAAAPFSTDRLVELMFGQCLTASSRATVPLGESLLELDDVSIYTYRLNVSHVSLQLRAGEVLGLAGLEGSGQRLLMQACAGIQRIATGSVRLAGQEMARQPYRRFLEQGVAFVPAARLEEGMAAGLSIREHFALAAQAGGFFVHWQDANTRAQQRILEYNIMGRPETPVEALSGGNQQRTLLALLPPRARLLVLEHPTRGLDIESTRWIWNRLLQRREQGAALMFTSTDLDELVQHSDRIMVFSSGIAAAPVRAADTSCEELGYLIGGGQR